jgi:hypothetical protein
VISRLRIRILVVSRKVGGPRVDHDHGVFVAVVENFPADPVGDLSQIHRAVDPLHHFGRGIDAHFTAQNVPARTDVVRIFTGKVQGPRARWSLQEGTYRSPRRSYRRCKTSGSSEGKSQGGPSCLKI